jgi:hypothetical protein
MCTQPLSKSLLSVVGGLVFVLVSTCDCEYSKHAATLANKQSGKWISVPRSHKLFVHNHFTADFGDLSKESA